MSEIDIGADPFGPKKDKRARQAYFLRPQYGVRNTEVRVPQWTLDRLLADEHHKTPLVSGKLTLVIAEDALNACDPIRTRCPHIDAHLATDDEFEKVFRSLVENMLDGRADTGEMIPCDGGPACARLALLKLLRHSVTIYADRWSAGQTVVSDWDAHRVALLRSDVRTLKQLIEASVSALQAWKSPGENLAKRLTILGEKIATKRLYGREVEWLTHVAWWSVLEGQDVPRRHGELVTDVSLGVNADRPLGQSVPVSRTNLENETAVAANALRPSLGFLCGHPRRLSALQCLGRFLHKPISRRGDFQIVFSTTYGLEVEYGLACQEGRFHVAFPVVDMRDGETETRLRWQVQSFEGNPAVAACEDSVLLESALTRPVQRPKWFSEADGRDLDGPLVIKLNGSPLHQVASLGNREWSPIHMLTFDQFDLHQRLAADVQWHDEEQSLFWKLNGLGHIVRTTCWVHLGQPVFESAVRTQLLLMRLAALHPHPDPAVVGHFAVVDKTKEDLDELEVVLHELGFDLIVGSPLEYLIRLDPR
jgi:hypothetical protein